MTDDVIHLQGGQAFFHCPGCECAHAPRVEGNHPVWQFNGDLVKPTFSPSILVRGTERLTDAEHSAVMNGVAIEPRPLICHSFVRDGKIEFLGDCTHGLKGQTVDLPKWSEA